MLRRSLPLLGLLLCAATTAQATQHPVAQSRNIALSNDASRVERSLLSFPARLKTDGVPLPAALAELQLRSGIPLAFSPTLMSPDRRVSCDCEQSTVGEALRLLLVASGFRFTELGSQILIEPIREVTPPRTVPSRPGNSLLRFAAAGAIGAPLGPPVASARQGIITGQALDATTRRPLIGVQVFIPETGRGTLTDSNGRFVLTNVEAGSITLRAQMIGYGSVEAVVSVVSGETVTANLMLQPEALSLDELVVTGTGGSARVREIGTTVSRLDAQEMENLPAARPQDILMGRVAGVSVNLGGGQPGQEGSIRLRGNNSISQGNQPLIYVDGVRIYSEHTPSGPGTSSGSLGLNSISPNDIERIEIVKGAAASTLYGTEAAGGVIQIFTKKGFSGTPQWRAELGYGVSTIGHYGPNWNKEDNPTGSYMNECRGPNFVDYRGQRIDDVTCPESGSWAKDGPIQNLSLSVRGGAGDVAYYLAGFVNAEESTAPQGWGRRGGFRGNISFRPFTALQLDWNNAYTRSINRFLPEGGGVGTFIGQATRGPGITYRIDGEPAAGLLLRNQTYDWKDHFVTGATVTYDQTPSISHRLTAGFDYNVLTGQDLYEFGHGLYPTGQISARDWRNTVMSLDYAGSFSLGAPERISSTLSWGGQYFYNNNRIVNSTSVEFAGPGDPTLSSGARREVNESRTRVVNAGLFLQEVLGFRDRLFLTGGIRFDGNSAFGSDFGIQAYPKLSASYVISDHDFWPDQLVESLRLRAAIGESGKAPGAFDAVRVWNPIAADDGRPGFTPSRLGNAELGPERTREVEAGFEAASLGGRLAVELTWYRQNVIGALVPVQPPPSQGFLNTQLENIGRLRNQGVEIATDFSLLQTAAIDWSARLNYSTTHSKALDLGGQAISIGSQNEVLEGYPIPVFVGAKIMNPDEYANPIIEQDQVLGQV